MAEAVGKYLNEEPIILGPGVKTGLQVKIDNPKELGPDRIANAVAGNLLVEEDVIVVDMGTATTFDVVTKNNRISWRINCTRNKNKFGCTNFKNSFFKVC